MIHALLATTLMGFVPTTAPDPPLEDFVLQVESIKVTQTNLEVFPEIELRPQESLVGIAREPSYKSKFPQKFVGSFGADGATKVAFAADEKRPGKGYATLIVDTKGDGELARGKRLSGKPMLRGDSYEDTEFGMLDIEVPIEGGTIEYPVHVRYSVKLNGYGGDEPTDSSLYLQAMCVLQGKVQLGEVEQTMMVFDANCNGIFGEKGTASSAGATTKGDKIWIGNGSPKHEDAYIQALPIGKYFLFGGDYYELNFGAGSTVNVKKTDVPLGKVEVSEPDFLLELVEGSDVLCVNGIDGTVLDMPTGDYRVIAPGFRRKGKGGIWELEGKPGACKLSFEVSKDSQTEIELGPPLKIIVDAKVKDRGATGWYLELKYRMEGANGEEYAYLRQNGKKVKLPEVSIRNSRGKEVKKGHFEYG